jgi:molecular chaperone GrpE
LLKGDEDVTGIQSSEDEENSLKTQPSGGKAPEADLLKRLKYMQADFENYRKRTEKEMKEMEESSSRSLVCKLLSVLDELDLAVKHSKEEPGKEEMQEGIEMVQKNLLSALEATGLQRIDALGQPFDPTRHEAVEKVQGKSVGSDIVIEEVRTGYAFRGRVIRPSMVKVQLAKKEPVEAGDRDE